MKIKFVPLNIEVEIQPNETVLSVARKNNIFIKSVCGGMPSCAECRVYLVEGEQNVIPPSVKEMNLIGSAHFVDRRRLACQLRCFGDITVDLTEQIEKQNQSVKRPQGGRVVSGESQAVMGTLVLDDKQNMADLMEKRANEMVEKELRSQALQKIKKKK